VTDSFRLFYLQGWINIKEKLVLALLTWRIRAADARIARSDRPGLLATEIVGEGGWMDMTEAIIVRAGEAFSAVPNPLGIPTRRPECSPSP
jgi:hypothetical protein